MKLKTFLIMALTLSALVTLGTYQAAYAHHIEITSDWRELGDVATIDMPSLEGRLAQDIAPGTQVQISLGYDGNNKLEFTGYVSEISPRIPYRLTCEDGAYQLKRTGLAAQSYKSITLRRLLDSILPSPYTLSPRIPEVSLSPYRIEEGATVAQVLTQLKDDYGICAYYRDGQLFVGLPYTEFSAQDLPADKQAGRYVEYRLWGDNEANIQAEKLTFRTQDQFRLSIRAVSILADNSRIEEEVGDSGGERRTLFFRNIRNQDALREIAHEHLSRMKYDGYAGSVETWGLPYVIHGATAALRDRRYPERAGRYLVDRVVTTWGLDGMSRSVTLGPKV